MTNPSITVILAFMKDNPSAGETLKSIQNQTFENFEVLIYVDKIQNIKIEQNNIQTKIFGIKKNETRESIWNRGLKQAKGKYLCFPATGDISISTRLKVQYEYLQIYPHVGLIGCSTELVSKQNGTLSYLNLFSARTSEIKTLLLTGTCLSHSSLMIRRSFIEKYNLFYNVRLGHAAEYDFMVNCASLFPVRQEKTILIRRMVDVYDHNVKQQVEQILVDRVKLNQLKSFAIRLSKRERELYLNLTNNQYMDNSELVDVERVLNRLIFKNKELKLYNTNRLYGLFKNLLSKAVKKLLLGGWSIEKPLVEFIGTILREGERILEFGSGNGTEALLRKFHLISIEHDPSFVFNRSQIHTCIYAPIHNNWYSRKEIQYALGLSYQLLLIDGPPRQLRQGILLNLDLFEDHKKPIIFDDVDRELDKDVMILFCNQLKYDYQIFQGVVKHFAYCTYRG